MGENTKPVDPGLRVVFWIIVLCAAYVVGQILRWALRLAF